MPKEYTSVSSCVHGCVWTTRDRFIWSTWPVWDQRLWKGLLNYLCFEVCFCKFFCVWF